MLVLYVIHFHAILSKLGMYNIFVTWGGVLQHNILSNFVIFATCEGILLICIFIFD